MQLFQVLLLSTLLVGALSGELAPRILGGLPVDTFRRFPHHVTIRTIENSEIIRTCSGSIISKNWILSSMGCVQNGSWFQLDFQRLYLNNTEGSYSISVGKSNVVLYPTHYDDLALIRLPVTLVFSQFIKAIALDTTDSFSNNQLAVMPGFTSIQDRLTYGMFRITTTSECKNYFGPIFDEYLQICSQGWGNYENVPCKGNEGGGLVIGWPSNPRLIGVFSTPLECKTNVPAIYMKLSIYIHWIISITGELGPPA